VSCVPVMVGRDRGSRGWPSPMAEPLRRFVSAQGRRAGEGARGRTERLPRGVAQLTQGMAQLTQGVAQLTQGMALLTQGMAQLTQGMEDLPRGMEHVPQRLARSP
jgi:X-X-X-Leu-X-X-Gly heptad repeat protein